LAGLQRIDSDRPFDVLELGRAEIGDRHIEPGAHLPIGVFREADPARLANRLQPGGDINPVAHEIAALLDDVADMDANAKFDALVGGDLGVAPDHRPLNFTRKIHCIYDAAEFDNGAVAGAFDDPAVMHGNGRIDQIAAKGPKPCKDAIFVRAGKSGVADNVGD
jgi:hypothetical protein